MSRTYLTIFLVAFLAVSASSFLLQPDTNIEEFKTLWSTWKSINERVYSEAEEEQRFAIFVLNYFKVISLNEQHPDAKFALNQFADLSMEEFKAKHLTGLKVDHEELLNKKSESTIDYSILDLPESVDWRAKGAVTHVKNQGNCGTCWAFSAVGALEGLHYIKTGNLVAFSEQQVISCDEKDGGCNGGYMQTAFEYTAGAGLETEADYPYIDNNGTCTYDATKATKINSGYKNVTVNNVEALKAAIAVQPVSVGVNADIMPFYRGGVISHLCLPYINHGVLAVGYGNIKGKDAFIIKNQWGAKWGDKGFGYISANPKTNGGQGVCGILTDGVYPTA